MKFTRVLAIVLAIMLLVTTTGCHKAPAEEAEKPANAESANAPSMEAAAKPEDESVTPADTSLTNYITSKDDFTNVLGSIVDLSLYELEDDDDSCNYYLKYENEISYDLDHNVVLSDGTEFTLDTPFSELESQGWVLFDPEQELDAGYLTWDVCKNSNGQELYIGIYNPTESTLTAKECTVCFIELTLFSSLDFSEKIDTTPGFTICKTITQASTLEEIVGQLGMPSSIYYSNSDGLDSYISIEYTQPNNSYDYLNFRVSANGNYIVEIDSEYIPK